MKSLPVALASHYQEVASTFAHIVLFTRPDGVQFAYTSAARKLEIDGIVYQANVGMDVSGLAYAASLAVDDIEMTALDAGDLFTIADVSGGLWRGTTFELSECNWASPSDGANPLLGGSFGEVRFERGAVIVELVDIKQFLQQPVGIVTSPTCRARLGDAQCTVDLGPLTVVGTITDVSNQQVFADSARTEADDWFTEGVLEFTSGACAGLQQKVKGFVSATGTFTLSLPMLLPIAIGDTYSVYAGCMRRWDVDCRDKHNNILNFDGEKDLPGVDRLSRQ